MEQTKIVSRNPEIMSGELVFAGTRVEVKTLIDYLKAGHSLDDFLEGFPTVGRTETFEMVLFDSYEIRERRAPYLGDRAVEIGSPTWKPLDRASVEMLVGEPLL